MCAKKIHWAGEAISNDLPSTSSLTERSLDLLRNAANHKKGMLDDWHFGSQRAMKASMPDAMLLVGMGLMRRQAGRLAGQADFFITDAGREVLAEAERPVTEVAMSFSDWFGNKTRWPGFDWVGFEGWIEQQGIGFNEVKQEDDWLRLMDEYRNLYATPRPVSEKRPDDWTEEEKRALIDKSKSMTITLDGKPASIGGALLRFAQVGQVGGPLQVEYSWDAVRSILDKGGQFVTEAERPVGEARPVESYDTVGGILTAQFFNGEFVKIGPGTSPTDLVLAFSSQVYDDFVRGLASHLGGRVGRQAGSRAIIIVDQQPSYDEIGGYLRSLGGRIGGLASQRPAREVIAPGPGYRLLRPGEILQMDDECRAWPDLDDVDLPQKEQWMPMKGIEPGTPYHLINMGPVRRRIGASARPVEEASAWGDPWTASPSEVSGLVSSGIVGFQGLSGVPATMGQAQAAPQVVLLVSSSGNTYDVAFSGGQFTFTPRSIVHKAEWGPGGPIMLAQRPVQEFEKPPGPITVTQYIRLVGMSFEPAKMFKEFLDRNPRSGRVNTLTMMSYDEWEKFDLEWAGVWGEYTFEAMARRAAGRPTREAIQPGQVYTWTVAQTDIEILSVDTSINEVVVADQSSTPPGKEYGMSLDGLEQLLRDGSIRLKAARRRTAEATISKGNWVATILPDPTTGWNVSITNAYLDRDLKFGPFGMEEQATAEASRLLDAAFRQDSLGTKSPESILMRLSYEIRDKGWQVHAAERGGQRPARAAGQMTARQFHDLFVDPVTLSYSHVLDWMTSVGINPNALQSEDYWFEIFKEFSPEQAPPDPAAYAARRQIREKSYPHEGRVLDQAVGYLGNARDHLDGAIKGGPGSLYRPLSDIDIDLAAVRSRLMEVAYDLKKGGWEEAGRAARRASRPTIRPIAEVDYTSQADVLERIVVRDVRHARERVNSVINTVPGVLYQTLSEADIKMGGAERVLMDYARSLRQPGWESIRPVGEGTYRDRRKRRLQASIPSLDDRVKWVLSSTSRPGLTADLVGAALEMSTADAAEVLAALVQKGEVEEMAPGVFRLKATVKRSREVVDLTGVPVGSLIVVSASAGDEIEMIFDGLNPDGTVKAHFMADPVGGTHTVMPGDVLSVHPLGATQRVRPAREADRADFAEWRYQRGANHNPNDVDAFKTWVISNATFGPFYQARLDEWDSLFEEWQMGSGSPLASRRRPAREQAQIRFRVEFSECEHAGDLRHYADAIEQSGGRILQTGMVPYDYETCFVEFEVADKAAFLKRFRQTSVYGYVGGSRQIGAFSQGGIDSQVTVLNAPRPARELAGPTRAVTYQTRAGDWVYETAEDLAHRLGRYEAYGLWMRRPMIDRIVDLSGRPVDVLFDDRGAIVRFAEPLDVTLGRIGTL